MSSRAINTMLIAGSLVLGFVNATMQSSAGLQLVNAAQFAGAVLAPPLVGLVIGGIRRLFGPTNIFKWMFGWSVVAVLIEVLSGTG